MSKYITYFLLSILLLASQFVVARSDLVDVSNEVHEDTDQMIFNKDIPENERLANGLRTLKQLKDKGIKNKRVLNISHEIGLIYLVRKDYKSSEKYLHEVLMLGKTLFDEEHPENLINMSNLGSAYIGSGQYKEAEILFKDKLSILRKNHPHDHPEIILALIELSVVYSKTDKAKLAVKHYCEAAEYKKKYPRLTYHDKYWEIGWAIFGNESKIKDEYKNCVYIPEI